MVIVNDRGGVILGSKVAIAASRYSEVGCHSVQGTVIRTRGCWSIIHRPPICAVARIAVSVRVVEVRITGKVRIRFRVRVKVRVRFWFRVRVRVRVKVRVRSIPKLATRRDGRL